MIIESHVMAKTERVAMMHVVASGSTHGMARVGRRLDMGRPGYSGAKSLNVATVIEPKAGSTAKTGQRTCFSTVHLFQLRAHKSNSDASNQPRDEGRESKAKLPNGESSSRGKHHGQQKKTDNSNHIFGPDLYEVSAWLIFLTPISTCSLHSS